MNHAPALRLRPFGPITRISFGLIALLISLVLLGDLLFGVVPGRDDEQRRTRQRVAENLSAQMISLLEAGDVSLLGKTVQQVLSRDTDIRGIAVRRNDGSVLLQHGRADGEPRAGDLSAGLAEADHVRVPIQSGRGVWGEVDMRFAPAAPSTWRSWIARPGLQMLALLSVGGFLLCYAYLRRAMQYLNPSASVPDRVRKAFDALTEGLLILDQESRVVLANRAFRRLHPAADSELNGQRIGALEWLVGSETDAAHPPLPWLRTLKSATPLTGQPLSLPQPDGPPRQLLVSSAPITDDKGRTRGCLVTFDDVTAVHRSNEELRSTLGELERSRQRIEEQNGELRRLASRDSLTGCLNRRAFFEAASDSFKVARRERAALCCLMVDIDHFKQFNDRYGHAVGDQVIQVVARSLSAGLRQSDVLCRYGGEEFCIVLPGTTPQEALAVAERMRVDIETQAFSALRDTEVMAITASFGLAPLSMGAYTLEELIDEADQALYRAKQNGRNRVETWQSRAVD